VFTLSAKILDVIRFPLRERFYRFAAVAFIIFSMFSATLLDFSYIPVFLTVFIFFFLGSLVSNPVLVFLFALSLPAFSLITLLNIFLTDNERLAELFISTRWDALDSWLVIFHIALLYLPVFLLFKRGILLSRILLRRKIKQNKITKFKILPALTALCVIVMLVQILSPVRENPPERRFITETSDSERNEILTLSIEDLVFLDSRIITLNLKARGNPIRFDVSIYSGTERVLLPLYSAPVPLEREDDGKRINLSLGEQPPNPLVMEIVVPLEFHGRLELAAVYNNWDPEIDSGEKPVSDDYVLRVSTYAYL
jgi:hypothetical protein